MGWKYWLPRQTLIVDLTFSSMEHVVRSVYFLFIKQKSPLVGNFSCTTDGIQGNVDFFIFLNVIQLIKNWVATQSCSVGLTLNYERESCGYTFLVTKLLNYIH